jgi:hypothetical protein
MDKYFIAVVISFTLSYFMGEGKNTGSLPSAVSVIKPWPNGLRGRRYTDAHTLVLLKWLCGWTSGRTSR